MLKCIDLENFVFIKQLNLAIFCISEQKHQDVHQKRLKILTEKQNIAKFTNISCRQNISLRVNRNVAMVSK